MRGFSLTLNRLTLGFAAGTGGAILCVVKCAVVQGGSACWVVGGWAVDETVNMGTPCRFLGSPSVQTQSNPHQEDTGATRQHADRHAAGQGK